MLRLTRISRRPHGVLVEAEGQIVAEWVGLLEEVCLELSENNHHVLLNVADVSCLDRQAVRLLRALGAGRVSIVNCFPLVEELLAGEAS